MEVMRIAVRCELGVDVVHMRREGCGARARQYLSYEMAPYCFASWLAVAFGGCV